MTNWLMEMFAWLGALVNFGCLSNPAPPPLTYADVCFQLIENHLGTFILILTYIILNMSGKYLSELKDDDDVDSMMLDVLNKWAECSSLETGDFSLRLSLCHLSRAENILGIDDSSRVTLCAGSHGGPQNGYLSVTTNQGSGELKFCFKPQLHMDGLLCTQSPSADNQTHPEDHPKVSVDESRMPKKVARRRWRVACLMIRILRWLLVAASQKRSPKSSASKSASTSKVVKKFSKMAAYLSQSEHQLRVKRSPKPILMFSKVLPSTLINEMVRQKLEAHVRRKTSQRLWGFPHLVIKYVGRHVAQLPAGDSKPKALNSSATRTKFLPSIKAPVDQGSTEKPQVTKKSQVTSRPKRLQSEVCRELAEHPEVLLSPASPRHEDKGEGSMMSVQRKLGSKLRRKFLEVKLASLPVKVLQSYHAAPFVTKQQQAPDNQTSLAKKVSTPKPQQSCPVQTPRPVPFMCEEDILRVDLNIKLKHTEHLQGKPTYYDLSREKMSKSDKYQNNQ